MTQTLSVIDPEVLSIDERAALEANIDNLIAAHKNNRQEINRLVFESVAAMSMGDRYEQELENKKGLKRFIGSITGSNKKLQDKINRSRSAAQYASQQTLQKLAEQNLMSFELITAVNNKLNASVVAIEKEINQIYAAMLTFFKQSRSDIIQLANRVDKLERNVNLLNWVNSIEYQMFNGTEYADLDDVSKVVCLVRDFCDITNGEWTTSDLLLLKTAMATIGLPPRANICYKDFIKEIANSDQLKEKLFGKLSLDGVEEYPEYVVISAGIEKNRLLETSEKYLVDNSLTVLRNHGCTVSEEELKQEMLCLYTKDKAQFDLSNYVNTYDFILEMLYNLEQVKRIQHTKFDNKMQEAEVLFSYYKTEPLIPLLHELIDYGYAKAKYVLALLYKTGCANLKRDDDMFKKLMSESAEEGYLPEKKKKIFELNNYNSKKIKSEIIEMPASILEMINEGDMFAAEVYAYYCYINHDYVTSAEIYKKAPLALGYYKIGSMYFCDLVGFEENLKKAFEYYKLSADMGYNEAENEIGLFYGSGWGCEKNLKKAFEYYQRAYLHGYNSLNSIVICYKYGNGVEKNLQKSFEYCKLNADMGDSLAEYRLGKCYENGEGCEKNPQKAFEYYKRSYEHGWDDAFFKYGWCLSHNFGTENDYDLAYKVFMEGSEKGYNTCTANVGWCYQNGRGVAKNMDKAKEYYKKAADMGNDWAKEQLNKYF